MHRHFHIEVPDPNIFLNSINNGKFYTVQKGNFRADPYKTEPFSDYISPKDFPECCEYHRTIKLQLDNWFNLFPDCCSDHRELMGNRWFRKNKYKGVPSKVVRQLSYTESFVFQSIDKENWFDEIANYFEYSILSFGIPSIGGKKYFQYLDHWIRNSKRITKNFPLEKKRLLIKHLEKFTNPPKKPNSDINVLNDLFQKWLKTFPNLEYFDALKKNHLNKFPFKILLYDPVYNRFTGDTKYKVRSKAELVKILLKTTKNILSQVDRSKVEVNKTYVTSYKIQIINESHRITQEALLTKFSKGEVKYIKVIKKWLKNEKSYFEELGKALSYDIESKSKIELNTRGNNTLELNGPASDILELKPIIETMKGIENLALENGAIIVESTSTIPKEVFYLETKSMLETYQAIKEVNPTVSLNKENISKINFNKIIKHILAVGVNLEKYKELHKEFGEELFRDYFIPSLNSMFIDKTVTGETFNKIGKTDILIQSINGENTFIAECKIWKGPAEFSAAIDQLFDRYVNWRDNKVALIFFNKSIKGFTEIVQKGKHEITQHKYYYRHFADRNTTSSTYIFVNPEDSNKKVLVELIFFNCYID